MNLGGRMTNPGELRTEISVQTRTMAGDAGGFQSPTWTTVATVLARWKNAHGSEAWTANAMGAEKAATVLMRYREDVDTTCAVLKGSERYEIVSVDNIEERNEYMELKVRRMAAG